MPNGHSNIDKTRILKTNGSLMTVTDSAILFYLHLAIISLEKQILVFLRAAVLHRLYCNRLILLFLYNKFCLISLCFALCDTTDVVFSISLIKIDINNGQCNNPHAT